MKLSPLATTFTCGLFAVGLLTGCATTAPSEQAPSPAVSVDRQAAAVSACADGNDCAIGDIGPGGGVVFYDAGFTQPWGRYMEAAPDGWNGGTEDPKAVWCGENVDIAGARGVSIGSGATNTSAIVAACATSAAKMADTYEGGGHTDWFLASKDELNELRKLQGTSLNFTRGNYWSSSQCNQMAAWNQLFENGSKQYGQTNDATYGFRPVRAF